MKIEEDLVTTRMEAPKSGKQNVNVAKTLRMAEYLALANVGDQASASGDASGRANAPPTPVAGVISRNRNLNQLACLCG